MSAIRLAILIYGEQNSGRNALNEEKYKDVAAVFLSAGFQVESVLYNDSLAPALAKDLLKYRVVLVWVNPIEQGHDRRILDHVLYEISDKGCFVSAHPEVILKIGTKEVLFATKGLDWGSDVKLYRSFDEFKTGFFQSLSREKKRVLKQYRGNGGNGVYKVLYESQGNDLLTIIHAKGHEELTLSKSDFYTFFKKFFSNEGRLIDQAWTDNIANGMVRCYLSGGTVAGFGYQEINALYDAETKNGIPPSKRCYFTEKCGIFRDLKEAMERKWVPQLQKIFSIPDKMLPVIWDADFFINDEQSPFSGKYTLCEINASCVSPFPPGSAKYILDAVNKKIKQE
ncbi:MAG: Cj0069 family protein [Ginsengibacter sp.]